MLQIISYAERQNAWLAAAAAARVAAAPVPAVTAGVGATAPADVLTSHTQPIHSVANPQE